MDTELQRRLDALDGQVSRLNALVAMQNGLIAAVVESLPHRVDVIRTFVESADLLPAVMGERGFSAVELAAFEEARSRLLASLDFPRTIDRSLN